jgi:hypothetical protein
MTQRCDQSRQKKNKAPWLDLTRTPRRSRLWVMYPRLFCLKCWPVDQDR